MSSITTYPSHSSVPAYVEPDRLRGILQRQQQDQSTSAPVPGFNYLIDIPISGSDVERWGAVFGETQGRVRAIVAKAAAAGKNGNEGDQEEEEVLEEEDAGLNSYFLNADIMLNHLSSDAQRAGSVYARLAPFAPFDATAVVTLSMTRVLRLRREWLPHRQQFPLHQQRTQFLDALLNHDLVALVGAAGSGRTLQTPIILSETEVLKRRRIVLVSATAVGARLTAVRLRVERGEDPHASRGVACALPLHNEVTPGTVIVTTTAEVLLRQLLADPLLLGVGCVIFDDVHLRSAETELCLAMLRERIALHRAYDRTIAAAAAVASANSSNSNTASPAVSFVKRLHVVVNCPDELSAAPLVDFFNAPVPTTSSSVAGNTSGGSGGGQVTALPPCSTTRFILESSGSSTDASSSSGGGGTAAFVRGNSNSNVFHLEELVQWLHMCKTEGRATLCADPEGELQSYVESVDVVTRVMAAADADFADLAKCREYWCPLVLEAIGHYTSAVTHTINNGGNGNISGSPNGRSTILLVAPNATVARLMHDLLRGSLRETAATAAGQPSFAFTLLDENRTDFETFLAVAEGRTIAASANSNSSHIVVTTPELAQTALPPAVCVHLLIDCARTSHRSFDVNAMTDQFVTEYASTQALRHRRGIAAAAKGLTTEDNNDTSDGGNSPAIPLHARFMTVQLIPKSVLHSAQHRRFSADPAQQHPAARLSFERYLRLYQALQARGEAALYAGQLAVAASTASAYLPMATVSSRVAQLLPWNLVAFPSTAAGNRHEHMRKVFTAVENYLVAAGHIDVDSASGAGHSDLYGSMKPLGVLATLLAGPLPTAVARMLILSAIFSCPVEGTALAALWIVGDAFNSSINSSLLDLVTTATTTTTTTTKSEEELREEEEDLRELTKEARLFFSRDSASDVVSGFNVYRMWLSMRAASAEDEAAFLEECKVPRRLLTRAEATHAQLYALLARGGLAPSVGGSPTTAVTAALSEKLNALSDETILDGKMQACLTGALYPNCAVMEGGRSGDGGKMSSSSSPAAAAANSALVLLDGLHVVSAGRNSATGTTVAAKRLGAAPENSVLSDLETAARVYGKPMLFLDRVLGASAAGTHPAFVSVIEQAAPLQQEASIVFCGEGHVRPKTAPTRCRGWTPCVTGAWRHTWRARQLPPPAQLPAPCIALTSYDTVKAASVIVSTDDNFQFTMRATTSQWLLQLRGHIQRLLRGFLAADQHSAAAAAAAPVAALPGQAAEVVDDSPWMRERVFSDVAEAWDWWGRRRREGPAWLREERAVLASIKAQEANKTNKRSDGDGDAGDAGEAEESSDKVNNLYGFYVFSTTAGVPAAQVLPTASKRKNKKGGATKGDTATAAGGAALDTATTAATAAAATAAVDPQQPKMYMGKKPNAEMDEYIRMCVASVATKRTREYEAQLLADARDTFCFLDPENQFHEYYLYRLREAAPTLEVLGDSIEELTQFLEKLEADLRKETGYKDPAEVARAAAAAAGPGGAQHQHGGHYNNNSSSNTNQQLREVVPGSGEEEEGGYYNGGGGMQVETEASVRIKKQSGLIYAPKPSEAAPPATQPPQPRPDTSVFSAAGGSSGPAGDVSGQQTLLEKLMAMKTNASGGGPATTTTATAAVTAAAPVATAAVAPSTEDLMVLLQRTGNFPAGSIVAAAAAAAIVTPPPAAPTPVAAAAAAPTAPSTAELLALLGGLAPAAAAPTAAPSYDSSLFGPVPPHIGSNGTAAATAAVVDAGPPMVDPAAMMALMMGAQVPHPHQQQPHHQRHQHQQQQQQPLRSNPLKRPPPPLPAKAVDDSAASVLVYPIPDHRRHGNVAALLERALGEELDMPVGPAIIVGRVARVAVPNGKVAARAIALRKFRCAGDKVYIFKNDRIADNAEGTSGLDERRRAPPSTVVAGGGGRGAPGMPPPQTAAAPAAAAAAATAAEAAASDEGDEEDPTSTTFQAAAAAQEAMPGVVVGTISDSDDDDN